MRKFKICMLGGFCVGKTSLVSRYVTSLFPETYLTTVGVKVDKKIVSVEASDVMLMIWDIYGEDDAQTINMSYLRGMSGYLLVADGTRPETLRVTSAVRARVEAAFGSLPAILMLNKCDLQTAWRLDPAILEPGITGGLPVRETSARTGQGVEAAFQDLARRLTTGGQA